MRFALILLLVSSLSCNRESRAPEPPYQYANDFKAYFKDTYNLELQKNSKYFVVPLNSCSECVDSALQNLAIKKFDWTVLLVGQTEDSIRQKNIVAVKQNYTCLIDSTLLMNEYALGIGLPSLLQTDNRGIVITKTDFFYGSWESFKP